MQEVEIMPTVKIIADATHCWTLVISTPGIVPEGNIRGTGTVDTGRTDS
jgi:hypothetical protein